MITKINNYEFIEDGDLVYSIVNAQHNSGNQSYALVHGLSKRGIQRVNLVQNGSDEDVTFADTQFFIPGSITHQTKMHEERIIPVKGIEPYALSAKSGIDMHGLYILAERIEYIGEGAFENAKIEYIALSYDFPVHIGERAFHGNEGMTITTTTDTLKQFRPVNNNEATTKFSDIDKLRLDEIFDKQLAFRLSFSEELENIVVDEDVKNRLAVEKELDEHFDKNEAEDAANYIIDDKVPDFEELDLDD